MHCTEPRSCEDGPEDDSVGVVQRRSKRHAGADEHERAEDATSDRRLDLVPGLLLVQRANDASSVAQPGVVACATFPLLPLGVASEVLHSLDQKLPHASCKRA